LAKRQKVSEPEEPEFEPAADDAIGEESDEPIPQDTLVCALTGELKPDKPEERVLQSLVEQLHREYRVDLSDMKRDVRIPCVNEEGKKKTVNVAIVVYARAESHQLENVIRVALIAKTQRKGLRCRDWPAGSGPIQPQRRAR
jgi:type I restriction enzyme M protein